MVKLELPQLFELSSKSEALKFESLSKLEFEPFLFSRSRLRCLVLVDLEMNSPKPLVLFLRHFEQSQKTFLVFFRVVSDDIRVIAKLQRIKKGGESFNSLF